MSVLDQADEVVTRYTLRHLHEATRVRRACGCRACVAAGNHWLAWFAAGDTELYERLRFRYRWEGSGKSGRMRLSRTQDGPFTVE